MAELPKGQPITWAHRVQQAACVRGSPKAASRRRRLCAHRLVKTVFGHSSHLNHRPNVAKSNLFQPVTASPALVPSQSWPSLEFLPALPELALGILERGGAS